MQIVCPYVCPSAYSFAIIAVEGSAISRSSIDNDVDADDIAQNSRGRGRKSVVATAAELEYDDSEHESEDEEEESGVDKGDGKEMGDSDTDEEGVGDDCDEEGGDEEVEDAPGSGWSMMGEWRIDCPSVLDEYPPAHGRTKAQAMRGEQPRSAEPQMHLHVFRDPDGTPVLYASFHLHIVFGCMKLICVPSEDAPTTKFLWRGFDSGRGYVEDPSSSQNGSLTLTGPGSLKGKLRGGYGAFSFTAERVSNRVAKCISDQALEEWDRSSSFGYSVASKWRVSYSR